jgi:peptidoglycan/xylan/chitin deacetylase (PgdA/CDA1 family)
LPICMTFDTERDFYGHVADKNLGYKDKSFSMLETAIPRLLKIGEEYKIPFTFFLCGEVAENCRDLFSNLDKHAIGVHTHPFTHSNLFKGKDINVFRHDLLATYSFQDQYQMILDDFELIKENLKVTPKAFRAGKMSHNRDTYLALDKIGLSIDCSQNPTFQLLGWRPFRISGTSVWEIPTYCDFSPETNSSLEKLMKVSSWPESLTHNIYVGYMHPMILGNPIVNQEILFDRFKALIDNSLKWGFTFWSLDRALEESKKWGAVYNLAGKAASIALTPPIFLARKMFYNRGYTMKKPE